MAEFNGTNALASVTTIYLEATNVSTTANVVIQHNITVSASTINEGKKTNIKVTIKDTKGNILKKQKNINNYQRKNIHINNQQQRNSYIQNN